MDENCITISDDDDFAIEENVGTMTNATVEPRIEQDLTNIISGLDMTTAADWIYPINFPVRDYQKNIVSKALFHNTLVSLPTGLGKTFIAAVVMYNFSRWYPHHKVIFMAHSKPLVAQQIDACCQIMGISRSITAELNGNIASSTRKLHWENKQIFFLTPQVLSNDLTRGLVSAESIRCVVIDEAHKALGNQAFCQVIKALKPFNTSFRVLALSATPGDDMPMVKSVVENLLISHLELRTEEDPDIQKYLHTKTVEAVVVSLDAKILEYKAQLLSVAEKYLNQLVQMKALGTNFGSLSSFTLLLKQKQFIANPSVSADQRGFTLSNFSIVISMYKALEELIIHGLRSFLNKLLAMKSGEGSKNNKHHRLAKDVDFLSLVESLENYIGVDKDVAFDPDISMAKLQDELDAPVEGQPTTVVYSHPKFAMLEQIIINHFESHKEPESTKVIVFCKSRPCTGEICNFLNRFRPMVKPMVLIGQSQTGSGATGRGLKQSAQLEVMKRFRLGAYNTLVATCVGEEGLDVGEVDLIVNFDATRNSNTTVQRSGRTGRKRDGRVVNLLTEGKEYQDYNISISKSKNMTKKLMGGLKNLPLYPNSPRLLPPGTNPVCHEMVLKPTEDAGMAIEKPQKSLKRGKQPDDDAQIKSKRSKPDLESEKKKTRKLSAKKGKANPDFVSQSNIKYDIRYAMSKAKEKFAKGGSNEESDNLFQSQTAVEIFKIGNKKSLVKENSEVPLITSEKENVIDDIDIFGEELNSKICDLLDTMDLDDLIAVVSRNMEKVKMPNHYKNHHYMVESIYESSDEDESEEYIDIPWPASLEDPIELEVTTTNVKKMMTNENPIEVMKNTNASFSNLSVSDRSMLDAEGPAMPNGDCNFTNNPRKTPEKSLLTKFTSKTNCSTVSPKTPNASMVSVTQAINMIAKFSNAEPEIKRTPDKSMVFANITVVVETPENKIDAPEYPESPIFECSGKQVSYISYSPVLENSMRALSQCPKESPHNLCEILPQEEQKSIMRHKTDDQPANKLEIMDDGSPSLVSTCKFKKKETKVRKSLIFSESQNNTKCQTTNIETNFSLFDLESDEDLFAKAEEERDVRLTQSEKNTENNEPNKGENCGLKTTADKRILEVKENSELLSLDLDWSASFKFESAPKSKINQLSKTVNKTTGLGYAGVDLSIPEEFNKTSDLGDSGWMTKGNKSQTPSFFFKKKPKKKLGPLQPSLQSFISQKNKENLQESRNVPFLENSPSNENLVSSFDCFPDDIDKLLNSSPIMPKKQSTPLIKAKEKTQEKLMKTIEEEMVLDDMDELSDGALEAIRAVEEYETKKRATAPSESSLSFKEPAVFDLLSSENSDDMFECKVDSSNRKKFSPSVKKRKKKKSHCQGRKKKNLFIEDEAELSGSCGGSSDEENTSGLDELDSSFIDERLQPTQAPNVDMTAQYLKTVRSPKNIPGAFKMPRSIKNNIDVFSQVDPHQNESYAYDSFCVDDDSSAKEDELSELELAEMKLKEKRKRKRLASSVAKTPAEKKKGNKRRRIIAMDSSSDDEIQMLRSPLKSNREPERENILAPVMKLPLGESSVENNQQIVVLIGSRTVARAPEITTSLRAKFKYRVEPRSCPGADYIVSWRIGINRIPLSDLCNGSPETKAALKSSLLKLVELFVKPIVIVEDDKKKGAPKTVGCHRDMWLKHVAKRVARLHQAGVFLFFTKDKDETAEIIGQIAQGECRKGQGVVNEWSDINSHLDSRLKFYSTLPGINVALALRLCRKFSSISSFLSVCDNVKSLARETGLPEATATQIHRSLTCKP